MLHWKCAECFTKPGEGRGGGGGVVYSTKFCTGRLRLVVQPLTLQLYTIFHVERGTPFVYLPWTNGTPFFYLL